VSGVWCLVSGVWCLVSGVWCLVSGVWCLVSGVWCLVSGVWCLVSGVWCLVSGVWCELVCGIYGELICLNPFCRLALYVLFCAVCLSMSCFTLYAEPYTVSARPTEIGFLLFSYIVPLLL
jgi:hypothetical protein